MKIHLTKITFILLSTFILFSCVRYKNVVLINENRHDIDTTLVVQEDTPYILGANDILNISAASTDAASLSIFLKNSNNASGVSVVESTLYLNGYSIDENGNIALPVIGELYVRGLTVSQVRKKLQESISAYFKFAIVEVKLASFRVSFLGEFKTVGPQLIFRNKINLLEALSIVGGFTDVAKIKKVKIIREINGEVKMKRVDFTDPKIVSHEWFYLKPNDVLYAEPLRIKPFKTNSSTISLVLSSVSVVLIVLNVLRR